MASLNSLEMRALAAQTTGIRYTDSTPVALRIVHVGTAAVTSVITTTGTAIVLTDATNVVTADFAGTLSLGTLGAVADYINSQPNWKCKVLDGLRSTITTANNLVGAPTTATATPKDGEVVYDILLNTTTTFTYPIRCSYDRTASNLKPKGGHRVKLVGFDYVLNVGTAAANMVRIYETDPTTLTETQIWQGASVKSTTTVTSLDFSKAPITVKEGNDLVVMVTDAASLATAGTNYMQALYIRE